MKRIEYIIIQHYFWKGYKDCYFIENGFICCFVTSHESLKKYVSKKYIKKARTQFLNNKTATRESFLPDKSCLWGMKRCQKNLMQLLTNGQVEENYMYTMYYTIFTHSYKSCECVNFIPVYSLYYYDNSEKPTLILMETCNKS